ncbi:MAG: hypothetical protein BGO41_06240 [Clostridiales bacterium 38-18]|nr:MAG: hypothetical protein BGO41_06240 [Clostridiales bacterium 38-18]
MMDVKTSQIKFKSAEATNTRLMGVVGVVAKFQDEGLREIVQVYHLDYEVYGIDGLYHLIEPSLQELEDLILMVTGGLGGEFVEITEEAFYHLVLSAYSVDKNSVETHVDFDAFSDAFYSWEDHMTSSELAELYFRLAPNLNSDILIINYLMMRLVGKDFVAAKILIDPHFEAELDYLELPYTLIKNTIKLVAEDDKVTHYQVEALIDYDEKYKLMLFDINLSKSTRRIVGLQYTESLTLSSIEAAFNLNKSEHIIVCQTTDHFFERRFSKSNPEMMKQTYYQGNLYIEFNKDNSHVNQNPYYLNGDVYAMYFFSRSGHFLVASLVEENLVSIDQMLQEQNLYEESLQFICELKTDDPVLYSYINSGYDTIFDFLSQ